jgi:hypothetical protein
VHSHAARRSTSSGLVPVFDGEVVERDGAVHRRHVHEHVQAAEGVHRLIHDASACVRIAQIRLHHHGRAGP